MRDIMKDKENAKKDVFRTVRFSEDLYKVITKQAKMSGISVNALLMIKLREVFNVPIVLDDENE